MNRNVKTFLAFILPIIGIVFLMACQSEPTLQADAGEDNSIEVGERPFFDGCASTGNIVNYKWTIITPSPNMPEDAGKVLREADTNCSFTLEATMGIDEVGRWVIELEVEDASGNKSTDEVTVNVIE